MKKRLVVANWKMYIGAPEEAKKFTATLRRKSRLFSGVDVVIAPSFTLLPFVAASLKGSTIHTGAQSVSVFETGAHTGEVAAKMVKSLGATYTIVGHSERRAQGETNESVHVQLEQAVLAGLTPILCVGEGERDAGGAYYSFVAEQLNSALKGFTKTGRKPKFIIAYEPVWAIGKSAAEAMNPAEVREMSIFIKKTLANIFERKAALSVPILYGGSVAIENAPALIAEGDITGLLVGHASANADSFIEILKSCKK